MTWHVTESIDVYAEHVWDLLALRADLNTIALTQITSARGRTSWSGEEPTFAWWSRRGSTSGAVSLTPPYEMLLNVVPDGTMDELVLALRQRATPVPGVNGTPGTATRFAELWTAGTTQQTVLAANSASTPRWIRWSRSRLPRAMPGTPAPTRSTSSSAGTRRSAARSETSRSTTARS